MAKARVFRSGDSQAVQLPRDLHIGSDEVEIFRRGEEIVLREKPRDMRRAFELITELPEEIIVARDDRPPQKREIP